RQHELGILGLAWSAPGAVLFTQILDLVIISGPLLAGQGDRWWWAKLRRTRHREWRHVGVFPTPHRCGLHIDAGLRDGSIGNHLVKSVLGAEVHDLDRDFLAQLDPAIFSFASRDASKVGGQLLMDFGSAGWLQLDQYRRGSGGS